MTDSSIHFLTHHGFCVGACLGVGDEHVEQHICGTFETLTIFEMMLRIFSELPSIFFGIVVLCCYILSLFNFSIFVLLSLKDFSSNWWWNPELVSLAKILLLMIYHVTDLMNAVRWPAAGIYQIMMCVELWNSLFWICGTIWIALDPVPITATRLPVQSMAMICQYEWDYNRSCSHIHPNLHCASVFPWTQTALGFWALLMLEYAPDVLRGHTFPIIEKAGPIDEDMTPVFDPDTIFENFDIVYACQQSSHS